MAFSTPDRKLLVVVVIRYSVECLCRLKCVVWVIKIVPEHLHMVCNTSGQKLSVLVSQELKEEETMFVWDYLETRCADVQCKELLVLALTHWGYHHDAQTINEAMMRGDFGLLDSESFRRGNERKLILTGIMKCDPGLVSDLCNLEAPAVREGV